jgi:peptide/nickel transport system permease protein
VDVTSILLAAAPVTLSLVFGAALIWTSIALVVGTTVARKPGSGLDRTALLLMLVAVSIHPLSIGLTLKYFLGYKWAIAPYDGYCPLTSDTGPDGCGGALDWASHLAVPWLAFALPFTALYTRMTRSFVRETLQESWVQTARAKGAPESRVLRSHVLRASLVPLMTMLGLDLGLVVGTVIYTEIVFDLPGLGALAYTSLNPGFSGFDLPTLVGVVVFTTVFVLVFNLLVDLLAPVADPRIGRA